MFFIDTALTVAGIGLSLWEGITSSSDEKEQAEINAESIRKEMELLRKQKEELGSMYDIKGGQVRDQFGNRMGSMLDRISQNVLQTEEVKRDSVARTGLSYSGTVERKADIQTSGQRKSNIRGQQGLLGDFKSNMMDLSMAEKREVGQIDIRLGSLEGQLKAAEAVYE